MNSQSRFLSARSLDLFCWKSMLRCVLACALLLGLIALPGTSRAAPTAATWYVAPASSGGNDLANCLTASTPCEHIQAAIDKATDGDSIIIASGTYLENLNISKSLAFVGAGLATTLIDGQQIGTAVSVAPSVQVSLSDLTIQNGRNTTVGGGLSINASATVNLNNIRLTNNIGQLGGGGVFNQGILKITNSTFSNNINQGTADRGGGLLNLGRADLTHVSFTNNQSPQAAGGAIGNRGTLTATATTFVNNLATAGGAIYNQYALILNNAFIAGNEAKSGSAGGIYNSGNLVDSGSVITGNIASDSGGGLYIEGTATLTGLSLTNNRAQNSGGGIYQFNGQLSLAQSSVSHNQAATGVGGGVFNNTVAQLSTLSVEYNSASSGGGIYNDATGNLTFTEGQIDSNTATQTGGGVNNRGALALNASALYSNTAAAQGASGLNNTSSGSATLINVTLSQNTATNGGALVSDSGTVRINNSTISHNQAPGLKVTGGTTILTNTIVALNTGGVNCSGAIASGGYNLDSGTSCGLIATGDITGTDPLLGNLQNNGGPTPTRSLALSSRAVDAGNNATCATTDQRGILRPQGDRCDIGAYEVLGFANTVGGTIPPNDCLTSTTTINNSFAIGSLQLGVNLAFIPRGDLRIKFYSPSSKVIPVLGATGGLGENLDVLWDDNSLNGPVGVENHLMTGGFYKYVRVPDSPLHPLFGQNIRGAWKLEVCNVGNAEGVLNRWTLVVNPGKFKTYLPLVRR